KNEIALVQGRQHRLGRDAERLEQERAQHQHQKQHRKEGFCVLDDDRFPDRVAPCASEPQAFEYQCVERPDNPGEEGREDKYRRKHLCTILRRARGLRERRPSIGYFLSACNTARNASCGISTEPICFMRRLPAFCFSRSLRLRVTSPP